MLKLFYKLFDILFRNARNRRFIDLMGVTSETTVLDVGGTPEFWHKIGVKPKVTLINVGDAPKSCEFPYIRGSACALPFEDKSFDIVFSNSMIEHLGSWSNQVVAASEMARVGKRVWVQTPNRAFPVDPHLLTPFVHWLPENYLKKVLPYTVAGLFWKLSAEQVDRFVHEIRLLRPSEMHFLFPRCEIATEDVAGFTKSLIAFSEPSH